MLMLHRAFSLAGTAVKASGTDAQPDAAGSVLWGLGSFPNKQKIAFVYIIYISFPYGFNPIL